MHNLFCNYFPPPRKLDQSYVLAPPSLFMGVSTHTLSSIDDVHIIIIQSVSVIRKATNIVVVVVVVVCLFVCLLPMTRGACLDGEDIQALQQGPDVSGDVPPAAGHSVGLRCSE